MNWFVRKWNKSLVRMQKYQGPDSIKLDNEKMILQRKNGDMTRNEIRELDQNPDDEHCQNPQ